MTDDLISRQQAVDALCKSECGWNNAECRHKDGTDFCVTCDNVKIIKSLPSAQPERKTGHWIKSDMQRWYDVWLCSECGEKTDSAVMSKPRYKYCPMCGAKMEEGREDE
jgi:DNA-directed RNA polymerase subunit RPC12/RpoP